MIGTRARVALAAAAGLFTACVVVQVFLAGLGVFDSPAAFITHRQFGYLFGWLTLVMLVLALVGRAPRRIIGSVALLLVLFALQSVFVAARTSLPAVAALHPLNGFAILALGAWTARAAWLGRHAGPVSMPARPATETFSGPGISRPALDGGSRRG